MRLMEDVPVKHERGTNKRLGYIKWWVVGLGYANATIYQGGPIPPRKHTLVSSNHDEFLEEGCSRYIRMAVHHAHRDLGHGRGHFARGRQRNLAATAD